MTNWLLQAVDQLSSGQLLSLAVAMDRTGSGHDGLLKAIVARALPSQGGMQGTAFGASELLEGHRSHAGVCDVLLCCNCTHMQSGRLQFKEVGIGYRRDYTCVGHDWPVDGMDSSPTAC